MRSLLRAWLARHDRFWDFLLGRPKPPRLSVRPTLDGCEARDVPGETLASLGANVAHAPDLGWAGGAMAGDPAFTVAVETRTAAATRSPEPTADGPFVGLQQSVTARAALDLDLDLAEGRADDLDGVGGWLGEPIGGWGIPSAEPGRDSAEGGGVALGESLSVPAATPDAPAVEGVEWSPQVWALRLSGGPDGLRTGVAGGAAVAGGSPEGEATPTAVRVAGPARVWVEAVAPEDATAGGVGGFRVWRDSSTGDLAVHYAVGGTATPGADYRPLSGTVVVTDGNLVAALPLDPIARTADAGRRDVALTLAAGPGYVLDGPAAASARLGRFDGRPSLTVSADRPTTGERSPHGSAVTFVRTTTDGPLTVAYTVGGTAAAGADYAPLSGSVVIPAGADRASVWVRPTADEAAEGDEAVVVAAAPSADYDLGRVTSATVTLADGRGDATPPANATGGPAGLSSHPVRYWDGLAIYDAADVSSAGFGHPWAHTRSWYNNGVYAGGINGNGWATTSQPSLRKDGTTGTVGLVLGPVTTYFDPSGGAYVPRFFTRDQLAYDSGASEFVLTDADGNIARFADFGLAVPDAKKGRLKKFTDRFGNVTEVTTWRTDGKPEEVQRSATVSGSTVTESYYHEYHSSGSGSGMLSALTLRRKVGAGSWATVRKAEYDYYGTSENYGNGGDLKTAVTKDGSGTTLNTEYYRYWKLGETGGFAGGLKYAFRGDSYARLADAFATPQTATDAQASPYADHYFEYDSQKRVTKETAKGAGSAGSQGGQGTFTFAYTTATTATGTTEWKTKTVETLPDGNTNTVYTNQYGGVILHAYTDTASGDKWVNYTRFDSQGRATWSAAPSGVTGFSDSYADLMNFQLGVSSYLRDDAGLFDAFDYYTSTTATSTTPGGVDGYLERTSLKRGELGTAVPQERLQFLTRTSGSTTIYPDATTTRYRNDDGTGGQTVTSGYTWGTGFAIESLTLTAPAVTTGQNGSGTASTVTAWFDAKGYPAWFKDAGGFLHYTETDVPTGAVTKTIADVSTSQTTTFTGLPSGWSTPSGGGLHLTASAEVDSLGRATKATDPAGNVTYAVFNDPGQEARVYPGWNAGTDAPTGPTQVLRVDRAKGYVEALTMSATPAVSGGRPTGAESVGSLQSLYREYTNAGGGQATHADAYFYLTGLTYSTSTSLGTSGTNFHRTEYAHDSRGRVDRVLSPAGTIYRSASDGQGRLLSNWVGLDDTPTSGAWSPSNTTGTDLVKVHEFQYDGAESGTASSPSRPSSPAAAPPTASAPSTSTGGTGWSPSRSASSRPN